ncbi:hypothetical protein WA158_005480 [Blastocystis sp. Blastoise]
MQNKKQNAFELPENQQVMGKLMKYSLYMFLFPLTTYALLYFIFTKVVILEKSSAVAIGSLAAVFITNIVIYKYIMSAFNEKDEEDNDNDEKEETKQYNKQIKKDSSKLKEE